MNVYAMVGSGVGTNDAAELCTRLSAWHDAMVAHQRKLRSRSTGEACDEECPHAEARLLWSEAVAAFGTRADDLTFLRSHAAGPGHGASRASPAVERTDRRSDALPMKSMTSGQAAAATV